MNLSEIEDLDLIKGKTKFYKKDVLNIYYKVLKNSCNWDFGLGYFSLSSIKLLAYPLSKFLIENKGKIRIYCNERISKNDYEILIDGSQNIDKLNIFNDLSVLYKGLISHDLELFKSCISFLICNNLLEIKVLINTNDQRGISHHKNSIFKDNKGNIVVLSGSANASEQALLFNREDTTAFCSFWNETSVNNTIKSTINEFEETFLNGDEDWIIYNISSNTLKKKLSKIGLLEVDSNSLRDQSFKYIKKDNSYFSEEIQKEIEKELEEYERIQFNSISPVNRYLKKESFNFPVNQLRDYQAKAISNWEKNNYRGILAMATGTGKTFTAFGAIKKFLQEKNAIIVICCPFKHLVTQWSNQIKGFGVTPILVFSSQKWKSNLERKLRLIKSNSSSPLFIVATNNSLLEENRFSKIMSKYWDRTFLIIDEAHNVGSGNLRKSLPKKTLARLGLSATIERYFDDAGTKFLKTYFGGIVFELPLKDAIGTYLVNYYYYAIPVPIEENKFEDYISLSRKISNLSKLQDDYEAEENLKRLLMKRARLVNNSFNKINWLNENIAINQNLNNTLFYVGDKLFQPTLNLLSNEKNIVAQPFYGETSPNERHNILREFNEGIINCLVAMKCLDEGVDVPSTKTAYFLASSGNPKEFVQRRGRVLRKSDSTGKKEAILYDLVSVPPDFIDKDHEHFEVSRSALRSQLRRIKEFSTLAINKRSSLNELFPLISKYNLISEL